MGSGGYDTLLKLWSMISVFYIALTFFLAIFTYQAYSVHTENVNMNVPTSFSLIDLFTTSNSGSIDIPTLTGLGQFAVFWLFLTLFYGILTGVTAYKLLLPSA